MSKKDVINEIIGLYDEINELKTRLEFGHITQEIFNFGREHIWQEYGERGYYNDSIIS